MSTPTSPAPDLRADLMQVTTQFQTALHNLPLDTRLVDVARLALPDACVVHPGVDLGLGVVEHRHRHAFTLPHLRR